MLTKEAKWLFYKYKLADTSLIEVLTTCKKEVNDQAYLCSLIKGRVNFEGYIFCKKTFFIFLKHQILKRTWINKCINPQRKKVKTIKKKYL